VHEHVHANADADGGRLRWTIDGWSERQCGSWGSWIVHPVQGQFFAHSTGEGHAAAQACCDLMSGWPKQRRWQSA
jgi:hypothetical protein